MRPTLFFFTCIILLTENFLGASQHKLGKASSSSSSFSSSISNYAKNNDATKQTIDDVTSEYYVPRYFSNAYQEYQLLANPDFGLDFGDDEKQSALLERPPPPSPQSSNFPSLVNSASGISLSGPDRLSKYKQNSRIPSDKSSTAKYTLRPEFRNLLASIRAIQPAVDERIEYLGDYIAKQSRLRQQKQQLQHQQQQQQRYASAPKPLTRTNLPLPFLGQAEYYDNIPIDEKQQTYIKATPKMESNFLPFQAEAMLNPYDELRDSSESSRSSDGWNKRQMTKTIANDISANPANVNEPKFRRKLTTSSGEPSLLQQNHNLVLPPQASFHRQKINSITSKNESILSSMSDIYFVAMVACVSSVAIFLVISAGYCFYKVQQSNKATQDVEFPAYGVIGPISRSADHEGNPKCSSPPSDRKLAQSAQMYHYHHQKQQMISTEKSNLPRHTANGGSDIESDEENEDGEYTVYECPGLAPTGEMEVKNPLFQDDLTPMSSPSVNGAISKQDSPKTARAATTAAAAANETLIDTSKTTTTKTKQENE